MIPKNEIIDQLKIYFPRSFELGSTYLTQGGGNYLVERLTRLDEEPLTLTHLNQCLHLTHQAGVSNGFFRYYFLTTPIEHPYPVERVYSDKTLSYSGLSCVDSLEQLGWGFRRFYTDALLYFGNIRSAYRDLRTKSYDEISTFYKQKRYDTNAMSMRGDVFPFKKIPVDDRYLIAEVACKAYTSEKFGDPVLLEKVLLERYRLAGNRAKKISELLTVQSTEEAGFEQQQFMLEFSTDEIAQDSIESEDDIQKSVKKIASRFTSARENALTNTKLFLSIVNELDIYIATSMRARDDFRNMAHDSELILKNEELKRLKIRYFDPTMSAAEGHEDKGLIECLMVKCAKALLYFAGEKDSFGKDAEVAMALSLGKPVVILCPEGKKGLSRVSLFKEIHPLSRLIHIDTGVACGAIVTQDKNIAATLLARMFNNAMEYDLVQNGDGYFRLLERTTGSVVRLHTNSNILREAFWNYYHNVP